MRVRILLMVDAKYADLGASQRLPPSSAGRYLPFAVIPYQRHRIWLMSTTNTNTAVALCYFSSISLVTCPRLHKLSLPHPQ